MTAKSNSSKLWIKRQNQDPYVTLRDKEGYRSRAAYKLLEIQEKHNLLKNGMFAVDLGAAPGGWLQVAKDYVGSKGRLIGLDLLPIESLCGIETIIGDFLSDDVYQALMEKLDNQLVDVVLSDMAGNLTGIKDVDSARAMGLSESVLEFAQCVLKPGGSVLLKVFQGAGFENLCHSFRTSFKTIKIIKPKSSRAASRECYLYASGYKSK